jgi:hypothetical protein
MNHQQPLKYFRQMNLQSNSESLLQNGNLRGGMWFFRVLELGMALWCQSRVEEVETLKIERVGNLGDWLTEIKSFSQVCANTETISVRKEVQKPSSIVLNTQLLHHFISLKSDFTSNSKSKR